MFRIDKSNVDNITMNKSYVVIRHEGSLEELSSCIEHAQPEEKPQADENETYQNAVEEAKLILENAKKEAEQIKAKAWQEGYKQGKEEFEKKNAVKLQSQFNAVNDYLNKLKVYKQSLLAEMENGILHLSLEIAEKIINIELNKDDKAYIGIVNKAVSKFNESEPFTLRVSQSEYDMYFKDKTNLLDDNENRLLEVIFDPNVGKGDFFVESDQTSELSISCPLTVIFALRGFKELSVTIPLTP